MDRPKFFEAMRSGLLGPALSESEVEGCEAILTAMDGSPLAYAAYAFATAYLETSHTMQPIGEFGGPSYFFRMYDPKGMRPKVAAELGNTQDGDGVRYHGRGYVQLTGRHNYATASKELGFDLLQSPDLVMRPDIAAQVMRRGMTEGWFTGKKFSDYLPDTGLASVEAFTEARRIINKQDRAGDIAGYARTFQAVLKAAGY